MIAAAKHYVNNVEAHVFCLLECARMSHLRTCDVVVKGIYTIDLVFL